MAFRALDMGYETDTTGIMLVGGVIKTLPVRKSGLVHATTSRLAAPSGFRTAGGARLICQ